MPRVALFSTVFLPYSQTFVYEEIRRHDRYEIEVFCARREREEHFPWNDINVAGRLYEYSRIAPKFDRRFRQGGIDLIHAHFGTGAVYAVPFARRYKLPLVVTFHGHEVPLLGGPRRLQPQNWPYAITAWQMLETMSLGLCDSIELLQILVELGVPRSKLVEHRLGLDIERFHKRSRDPNAIRVTMVGRFAEKKGFESGLEAFARVAPRHKNLRLWMIGSGEREPQLRAIVQEARIQDRVEFTGPIPHLEVAERLGQSDIVIAPSVTACNGDRESGMLTAKEASASEAALISTWHGGIPSIVDDGVTGYLVPERDPGAIADRLERLIADSDLRVRLGRAARAKMLAEYDNKERVAALADLYDRVLAGRF